MQPFIPDADTENWHDFEVGSRREIIALLRKLSETRQTVRVAARDGGAVYVTSILEVDGDTDTVLLDRPAEQEHVLRLLTGEVSFETSLDKIRIFFGSEKLNPALQAGLPALKMAVPASLIRLQRREYYRMQTPLTNPVRVTIPLPPELGGSQAMFPLADISVGGIAILDNQFMLGDATGRDYHECRIELPDLGNVTTGLQIRNTHDITQLNSTTNRRLGCQFTDMGRGAAAAVQRYITKLERERNARINGLG
ncbi:flagellar brake protein [Massilia dura]|uniref:Flagellar brake protein YcgR n=1 Tax=Pseudoduganella dura TaxID=321982 RepID=A0A6I3XNA9_9BURK|nr:flagellar brake protein [Pseudoduganella dura]MUI14722.1 flagellar brake protein [Pseudoduganella dura]GGX98506.1 flagellar brake protein YcgR [Pseudoduganella dura]